MNPVLTRRSLERAIGRLLGRSGRFWGFIRDCFAVAPPPALQPLPVRVAQRPARRRRTH